MCHAFMNLLLHFISSRIQTPAILLVLTVSSAPPAMAICSVPGCNKKVSVRWPPACNYQHYLEFTGQRDEDMFPTCEHAGFFVLHHVCTYSIGWDGIRAVVTASLGFDSCAVCCAFVFPNAGCNRLRQPDYDPFCSYGCQFAAGGGAPPEEWLTCVVPGCNKKRGVPYYGAKYFVFITYLIYLIHSGGNRLCFF